MTRALYHEDAYLRDAGGRVKGFTDEGGIILDATNFYPTSGGQPGDSGTLSWDDGKIKIAMTIKGQGADIVLVPAEPAALPAIGTRITQEIDWDRRLRHMRVHTALHLLSVVIPLPVTGGAISADKGRLDFNMPVAPQNKDVLDDTLNRLIACNFAVSDEWITDVELEAQQDLVKSMSVAPPKGTGKVRLVRIGMDENTADIQACGGTHVSNTSEIGRVRIGKIEKKGQLNRRVYLHLEGP